MVEKVFDVYGIIGVLISIAAVLISIYVSPTEIPLQYIIVVIIVIIGIGILGITMILLNRFSSIDSQIKKMKESINKKEQEIEVINKRFKTLEELNDIRLNIRELKREVFKK